MERFEIRFSALCFTISISVKYFVIYKYGKCIFLRARFRALCGELFAVFRLVWRGCYISRVVMVHCEDVG